MITHTGHNGGSQSSFPQQYNSLEYTEVKFNGLNKRKEYQYNCFSNGPYNDHCPIAKGKQAPHPDKWNLAWFSFKLYMIILRNLWQEKYVEQVKPQEI